MRRASTIFVALFLMGSASGCGPKLEVSSNFEMPLGGSKYFMVDPIKNEQTIKVTGSATAAPVNVFIYLEKNKAAAENEILTKKFTPVVLAKQDKTEAINLEITIPAHETAVVQVTSAGKTAQVQLKITNK